MDFIQSLQEDILKPDIELSSILKKAKVLASTLKNKEIKVHNLHLKKEKRSAVKNSVYFS